MLLALRALMRNARLWVGVFLAVALLQGCALIIPQTEQLREAIPSGLPDRVELASVPFFPQKDFQCGPAALATTLASFGQKVTPEDLVGQVYLPARKGSLQIEMLAAPRRYGMVSYELAPRLEDMLREISAGNPVIVLQDYGVGWYPIWHYAVAVGYDLDKGELILRSGEKERLVIPFGVLEYTWKESKYWAMVAVPPNRLPTTATESRYLAAINAMEHGGNQLAIKTAYTAFLQHWPDNLAAGIGLANAHYALGELAEAETVLRQAAAAHPDSAVVLNNLAQTVSDTGRDDEALQLIDTAVALQGPFADTVSETRKLILRRMGRVP